MIDYIIVGSGFFGATCARLLKDAGKSILIIEKNNYVGGHSATEIKDDIIIHKYGPHVFHTNNKDIWDFVNKFGEFNNYQLKVKVNYKNKLYSFPINLLTLHQIFGCNSPEEAKKIIEEECCYHDSNNFEQAAQAIVGNTIYEMFYKGYTTKQWGVSPDKLPVDLFNRLPIRFNFDDTYFSKHRCLYQGVPKEGYTKLIENMLFDIPYLLNTNFLDNKNFWLNQCHKLIFTGSIDKFWDYKYGILPYRSLKFKIEKHDVSDYQGCAVINYTDMQVPYTRITEHKHFDWKDCDYTYISKEFPANFEDTNEPYYPINNKYNDIIYKQYQLLSEQQKKVIFGGRLGSYKYLDMDQTIESAMKLTERLI